jgi:GT2 family glycosyltransferase
MISVSMICYNKPKISAEGIWSVLDHAPRDGVEFLLTDNGSAPDMRIADVMKGALRNPCVRLIEHDRNLGVIKAKNHALTQARGEFFVSLDNDCRISAGSIEALMRPFQDLAVAQVGRDGGFGRLTQHGVGTHGPEGYIRDYIDGSCFAVRTEIARQYGLCDPAYEFAYCEDSDFSLRLRKGGWRIATVKCGVRHLEHQTAHGAGLNLRQYWKQNHRLFMSRWGGYLKTRRFGHPGEPEVPRREEISIC